jgi:twinkle protein
MYRFIEWSAIDLKGKTSGQKHVPCPNCNKGTKDAALSVNITEGKAICHRCESISIRDKKEDEIEYELPPQQWQNHTKISDKVVKWFSDVRKISQRTLIECKITEQIVYFPQKQKDLNAICFNYFDNDVLVSTKFRSGDKDFTQSANTKKIFYGINDIKNSDEIIIVEGEIDKLSFWEADIKNVISVPNGANDVDLFKDNPIFENKKIVIAVDTDQNGVKLENGILDIFGESNCFKITFPKGCKDANDVLQNHNHIELSKLYENKVKYSVLKIKDYLFDMGIVNNQMNDFLEGKIKKGFRSNIEVLDNHFVFKRNEFYVLTGKKGSGKTTINQALQIIGSVSNDLIWVVAFQENDKWAMKLNYMNYLLGDYAKDVKNQEPEKYKIVSDWVDKHFYFLKVESIKEALDVTKTMIEDLNIDIYGVLLDPINSFKSGFKDSGNGYADGKNDALEILNFSLKYCSVFVNQHPTISAQRQEGAVSSYQGEGGWFLNKASFIYVINREKGSSDNELIVESVRNMHTGGSQTDSENPVILEWSATSINVRYKEDISQETNVIQRIIIEKGLFDLTGTAKHKLREADLKEYDDNIIQMSLPNSADEVPF